VILEYFEPAYRLGMTATPLRADNRYTYRYFGNPIFEYSLRQGIDDGFLATPQNWVPPSRSRYGLLASL
jgi:type I restriction enzyme R subunit